MPSEPESWSETWCGMCGGGGVIVATCTLDCGDGVSEYSWEELAPCPVCVTGEQEPPWWEDIPDREEEW